MKRYRRINFGDGAGVDKPPDLVALAPWLSVVTQEHSLAAWSAGGKSCKECLPLFGQGDVAGFVVLGEADVQGAAIGVEVADLGRDQLPVSSAGLKRAADKSTNVRVARIQQAGRFGDR